MISCQEMEHTFEVLMKTLGKRSAAKSLLRSIVVIFPMLLSEGLLLVERTQK